MAIIIQGCTGINGNPCSLSEKTWYELKKEDSLVNSIQIKQRDKDWMKYNYDEPSLFKAENETYRLIQSCSGSSYYIKIVRIEKHKKSLLAIIKEFKGSCASDAEGSIDVFVLPTESWSLISNKLTIDNFWTSTTKCKKTLLHGCTWRLEAYKLKKDECTLQNYHRIAGCFPVDSSFISMYDLLDKITTNQNNS